MTDRRILPFNGRVAHECLRGHVEAEIYTKGTTSHAVTTVVSVSSSEHCDDRERQLVFGQGFRVLEYLDNDFEPGPVLFGFCERDGYVGYILDDFMSENDYPSTHKVSVRLTCLKPVPNFKSPVEILHLPLGAEVHVECQEGAWSKVTFGEHDDATTGFLPSKHLAPIVSKIDDPISVAEEFLGAPYLWGGNSTLGVDCSGLVQAACLACGLPCPGDSDMQEAELGTHLPDNAPLQRGDLLFWKGHVAWVADPGTLLHANAFHMAVAYEPLQDAIQRIKAQGDGPVTARKRLGEIT